ncbi:polysaccharide pyruvyl transferase family protein [bacterium]|nr:polysaccharide pyruvyl transferase family protein [bacterium]
MDKVLLLGYFGAGNFGDDALLADWLISRRDWLAGQRLAVDITVSGSADPVGGFHESGHLRELVGQLIPKERASAVRPDDYAALIAPGGSLLQDVTSLKSLLYYLFIIRRFNRAGVPVYLLNQGIGPLNSWLADFLTPRYLARTALLSVRDADSHHWALSKPLLKAHPALELSCDPLLDPSVRTDGPDEPNRQAEGYAVVIAKPTGDLPHPGDAVEEHAALARLLDYIADLTGLRPLVAPLHGGQDVEFCEKAAAAAQEATFWQPAEGSPGNSAVLELIRAAGLVISYRLHGLVIAGAYNVPALGVAYDPKIIAFCGSLALPYCFPATVHEETAFTDLRRLWENRGEVQEVMAEYRQLQLLRLKQAKERFDEIWDENTID